MSWLPTRACKGCFSFKSSSRHNGKSPVLGSKNTWAPVRAPVTSWDPMKHRFFALGCHLPHNGEKQATGPFWASSPSAGGPENGMRLGWVMAFQGPEKGCRGEGYKRDFRNSEIRLFLPEQDSPSLGSPAPRRRPGPRAGSAGSAVLCRPPVAAGPSAGRC